MNKKQAFKVASAIALVVSQQGIESDFFEGATLVAELLLEKMPEFGKFISSGYAENDSLKKSLKGEFFISEKEEGSFYRVEISGGEKFFAFIFTNNSGDYKFSGADIR